MHDVLRRKHVSKHLDVEKVAAKVVVAGDGVEKVLRVVVVGVSKGAHTHTHHHVVVFAGIDALIVKQMLEIVLEKLNHPLCG